MHNCKFCDREYENPKSVASHTKWCNRNPNKKIPFENINKKSKLRTDINNRINKNKSKIDKTIKTLKDKYKSGELKPPMELITEEKEIERRVKLSNSAKSRKLGGYIRGSGRGKKGWYKGFFCDSSWELAYVIYCLEHNMDIKRNTEKRTYEHNGKIKNYIPDFIVNCELVEVKGYKSDEWLSKMRCNPDVKVLYKEDIKDIMDYVKKKYGVNFIELYE